MLRLDERTILLLELMLTCMGGMIANCGGDTGKMLPRVRRTQLVPMGDLAPKTPDHSRFGPLSATEILP